MSYLKLLRKTDSLPEVLTQQAEPPMPPKIEAAYERGESITFVRSRGCWELYEAPEPPVVLSDEVCSLLLRYDRGELPEQVYNRLTTLFHDNPPDIQERLSRAALFVKEAS